jgi:hypothetical protein
MNLRNKNSKPNTPRTAAAIGKNEGGRKFTLGSLFLPNRRANAIAVVTAINKASKARYAAIHKCRNELHFFTDTFVSFATLPTPNIRARINMNRNADG